MNRGIERTTMNKDILELLNTLALEILVSLDESYAKDEVKKKVLSKLIADCGLQDQIENSLRQKVEELTSYYDFFVYKIASGQENYPKGGKEIAGFVTDPRNEVKK